MITEDTPQARAVAAVRQFAAERIDVKREERAGRTDWRRRTGKATPQMLEKASNLYGTVGPESFDVSKVIPALDGGAPLALDEGFYEPPALIGRTVVSLSQLLSDDGPSCVVMHKYPGVHVIDDLGLCDLDEDGHCRKHTLTTEKEND